MTAKQTIIRQPKQVQGFVENLNGVPLDMILIPSGTFVMGAPETEEESSDTERPQHKVTVSTFFMGRYPITQAQWQVVAAMPQERRKLKPNPSIFKGDKRPVECVSWYDAMEFCARLSCHTEKDYRLPSEAEWEYACRAGTSTPFHFGETISTELANYRGTDNKDYGWSGFYGRGEKGAYREQTTDVDSFKVANAFGLSDLHGNVWEWCLGPWHRNYQDAPTDGRVWDEQHKNDNYYQKILENLETLLKDKRSKIIRGGSWNYYPGNCRSASRYYSAPDSVLNVIGFRVVCGLPRTF